MSATNFKRPISIDPQERRDERNVNIMAMQLNPQSLETLLHGTDPMLREALLVRLRPYLQFDTEEAIADCARCGMRRGSVIAHECLITD